MFNRGDMVIYGGTGVCRISDITMKPGVDGSEQPYYVLKPLLEDCIIYTPVDGKVFMRRVISKEEANRLIDMIPGLETEAFYTKSVQELTQHYKSAINTHSCEDLIELTMSIYEKKQDVEKHNRKFGQVDERFMKQAEELLFSELAVALEIQRDEVREYIADRLSAADERQ